MFRAGGADEREDVGAHVATNPNTLGVFEQEIHKMEIMHAKGGLLYMDGANMNALVGKSALAISALTMHLNLHKTFSTPTVASARFRSCGGEKA
jgi:glycine dehydrogenase subunit 2